MEQRETHGTPEREPPATAEALRTLFHARLLSRAALEAGMREIGAARAWRAWAELLLLVLGGSLVLAGISFFVAYNWADMDKAVKLGGLQLLVVASVIGAALRGLDRVEGRALLFAACVLVGLFLAAFGQVYQTGADAWELLRAWALLITLWVVVARAPVHWLLLLAITDAGIACYADQVRFYNWRNHGAWLLLATTQVITLVGFEFARSRDWFRLRQTWPRWVLVPCVIFHLCTPVSLAIVDDRYDGVSGWLAFAALAACLVVGFRYYRHVGRDLFALTCLGFGAAWIVTALALRLLVKSHDGSCGSLVVIGLLEIGMLSLLVRQVRRIGAEMQAEDANRG